MNNDIKKILSADHHDPFSVLGSHLVKSGAKTSVTIRAFLPEAKEVVVKEKNKSKKMKKIHKNGFFEVTFPNRKNIFPYTFEVSYNAGDPIIKNDPYCHTPVLSDFDMHLFSEGKHHRIYEKLGAHPMKMKGISGVFFAVWAPNAKRASVVGDFNFWDGRVHSMRNRGTSGLWELFIPDIGIGAVYKFEFKTQNDDIILKSDPYAFYSERRPNTASIVFADKFKWSDKKWLTERDKTGCYEKPMTIYEVHLPSWMRDPKDSSRILSFDELSDKLIPYVKDMGYTHIELLPVAEHPLDQSWGYQVTGYFAVTSRHGTPEGFKRFVDKCHKNNIGIIIDWVPGHFPKDAHGLACFDGTHLYEHSDPRIGEHNEWGTLVFNYGRNEIKNFLIANVVYWFDEYHIDGIRVDAVASMLYLDYSREEGEWIPNRYGGRENLEAIDFLKELNEVIFSYFPGAITVAEESTSWPRVSHPTYLGGLGFGYKWNMGWMNDILSYFSKDPIHRKYHHGLLTFAMLYAFHENFVLVLSHDEVVHGKRSLLDKMPGDLWQKFANLRLLFGYMYAQPGKKLLFMGGEFGQWIEWRSSESLDWHLLDYGLHKKMQEYVKTLNHLYTTQPALYETDFDHAGFEWIDFHDTDNCVISFIRYAKDRDDFLVFVFNCTPIPRNGYRLGVPKPGFYHELLNSDADMFGGGNIGNKGGIKTDELSWQMKEYSIQIDVPPLSSSVFKLK